MNRPSTKGIKGVDSFKGKSFPSSRWDHAIELCGKRVACIGNGPSAAQFIPEVAEKASRLLVFQHSAAYLVPRNDRPYTDEERKQFVNDQAERQKSHRYTTTTRSRGFPLL